MAFLRNTRFPISNPTRLQLASEKVMDSLENRLDNETIDE